LTFKFCLHGTNCDPENTLATSKDVDDFVGAVGRVNGLPVGKQCYIDQGLVALQLANQDLERLTDLLEAHARIEQPLDNLQLNDVGERVSTL
jgi:hypothetical protein